METAVVGIKKQRVRTRGVQKKNVRRGILQKWIGNGSNMR